MKPLTALKFYTSKRQKG